VAVTALSGVSSVCRGAARQYAHKDRQGGRAAR
jgi:hypothetical protein